jgi:hypothetical protein
MPRPKNGYVNAAGQPVPGTHDPISRYMDKTALMHWAHKQGCAGLPLYDRSALDIGATVHGMAELDLKGRPDREIEAYAHDRLVAPDHLQKAFASFGQFREWRQQCHVRAIAQEVSMVSEVHQFGGTPDTIAMIGDGLGLIDFKTSPKPYPDHLIALAAYGRLWEENHPQQPLSSYHLIILPKDGTAFAHHAYGDVSRQWKLFTLYLEAWRLDKGLDAPPVAAPTIETWRAAAKACDAAAAPAKTALDQGDHNGVPAFLARSATVLPFTQTAIAADAPKPRRPRKPQAAKAAPAAPPAASSTMAEMLRAYGHVKPEVAQC